MKKLPFMSGYIGCCVLLAMISLYVITLPVAIKIIGYAVLFFYACHLLTRPSIKRIVHLSANRVHCYLQDGTICFATISNDSIFLRWFVLIRFISEHNKAFSMILFKGSPSWSIAQQIRQQQMYRNAMQ